MFTSMIRKIAFALVLYFVTRCLPNLMITLISSHGELTVYLFLNILLENIKKYIVLSTHPVKRTRIKNMNPFFHTNYEAI